MNKLVGKNIGSTVGKILSKTVYIWEFLFSIIFALSMYILVTRKHYMGAISKKYLLITIFAGGIVVGVMIYNILKNRKRLESIFATFMIPIGLLYMIFMLPTYAPDEIQHIWKAYDVSQGNLFTRLDGENNSLGVDIPQVMTNATNVSLKKYSSLNELIKSKTDYNETINVITPAQGYCFIFYIPTAIIFFLVRNLNISIIIGIYLAKIWNFILFVLTGYYLIKKMPFGKYVIFTIMFLPMVIQQQVSLSADAMINIGIFIYTVFTISLLYQKEKIGIKQKIIYMMLILFVSIAKMVYFPMIGLGFLLVSSKNMNKKDKYIILGLGTILCILLILINYKYTSTIKTPSDMETIEKISGANASEQVRYLIHNPINYFVMLKNTIKSNAGNYIDMMIGAKLGWLDINIPQIITYIFIIMLAYSCIIEDNNVAFSCKEKIWTLVVSVGTILLIVTVTYILWTSVGAKTPSGVQGRYFIPVLPLALLSLSMKNNYIKIKNREIIIPLVLLVLNIFVVNSIFEFFI